MVNKVLKQYVKIKIVIKYKVKWHKLFKITFQYLKLHMMRNNLFNMIEVINNLLKN